MNAVVVLEKWMDAINSHDVNGLRDLMGTGFVFVDAVGTTVEGAEEMKRGWKGYFSLCPDYWIRADSKIAEGSTVLAAGEAGGTIDGIAWRIPAAWKAIVKGTTVTEWRVYADNKPVYDILSMRRK